MFADPGLIKPETIEMFDQCHVPVDQQRRVFSGRVEWRHEDAKPHAVAHDCSPLDV
jgi:hypothetical protein